MDDMHAITAAGLRKQFGSTIAVAGVDLQVYRALYATLEGRYTKSSAKLSSDFVDFDPIDLSGFKLSAGFNLVF